MKILMRHNILFRFFSVFILTMAIALCVSCFKQQKLSKQNLAYLYSIKDIYLQPDFKIFHSKQDTSVLYFQINSSELLYVRESLLSTFNAHFSLHYILQPSFESKIIIDSATYFYHDTLNYNTGSFFQDSIYINIPYGQDYLLSVELKDLNRKKSHTALIKIQKNNLNKHQFFQTYNTKHDILFKNYVNKEDTLVFQHNTSQKHLFVKYYKNNFPIATPPFHVGNTKPIVIYPDTVFSLSITNGFSSPLFLNKEGVYRILPDSSSQDGLSIIRFHEDFPLITLPNQMINSVRYLTSRKEYDNMIMQAHKREAIEAFWLEIAGNKDRARQLIRNYYSRVYEANQFFTTYHEGWKTDRGMIYIIFGPPNTVYKTNDYENWIYGEATNIRSINFNFYKTENPLSDNDYMLGKSDIYKDVWYYAVSTWRR